MSFYNLQKSVKLHTPTPPPPQKKAGNGISGTALTLKIFPEGMPRTRLDVLRYSLCPAPVPPARHGH